MCYWARLIQSGNKKLSGILFQLILNLHKTGRYDFKWLDFLKKILNDTGFSYLWECQLPISSTDIKSELKQRLIDQFCQGLFAEMENYSRGKFYATIKNSLCIEKYLLNLNIPDRIVLCRFRCSNFKIPVETGRWSNIPRNERICNLCDMNVVGDEYHYLFKCTNDKIKSFRAKYIPNYYVKFPTVDKMKGLLSICNIPVLTKLCMFFKQIEKLFV